LWGLAETAPQDVTRRESVQPGRLVTPEVASVVTGIDADSRVELAVSEEYFRCIHNLLNESLMDKYWSFG
jgi:hypothetical protein